jgi:hypothetical protein
METKAREVVDADKRWTAMTALAETVLREGQEHWTKVKRVRGDFKQERFVEWHEKVVQEYAGDLRDKNRQFEGIAEGILTAYPGESIEAPVTSIDGINLNTRLRLLTEATPEQAAKIVRDGVQRRDGALLDSARVLLESWPEYRNAWSGPEGKKLARELLDEIDEAVPELDRMKGIYARDQVETYRQRWRYMVNHIFHSDGQLDPVHRMTGSLDPLLKPLAE